MSGPNKNHNDEQEWFNAQGDWHREDGPAVEYPDGSKEWFLNSEEVDPLVFMVKQYEFSK